MASSLLLDRFLCGGKKFDGTLLSLDLFPAGYNDRCIENVSVEKRKRFLKIWAKLGNDNDVIDLCIERYKR